MRCTRVSPYPDRDAWEVVVEDEFGHRHRVDVTGREVLADPTQRRPAEIAMAKVLKERGDEQA